MKLAVIHGPGDLRLDDVQRPKAGPDDVVIKVAATGICGSDVAYRIMGGVSGPSGKPLPIGHEFAGEIVEVGENVRTFKVGERVAYNSFNSPADFGRGSPQAGFSNYVSLQNIDSHAQSLERLPDGVSLEHAALVEPLSVAMHAVNRADPKPGESIAIFGAGPIGLGIIIALRWRGIEDIAVFDLSKLRLDRAMALGARAAFDPRETPPAKALGELRGYADLRGHPMPSTNIYFEATGAEGLLEDIINFCHLGSRIVTVAIQKKPLTVSAGAIMGKELTLMGSLGYPKEFPEVMTKLAEGAVDPEMMISHRYPFADFLAAFETAADPASSAKVLIQFD
jgi:(R,R)-butanediol dehydrogenase/meso-butanediol dehydrogenase/diacetyl reductase